MKPLSPGYLVAINRWYDINGKERWEIKIIAGGSPRINRLNNTEELYSFWRHFSLFHEARAAMRDAVPQDHPSVPRRKANLIRRRIQELTEERVIKESRRFLVI